MAPWHPILLVQIMSVSRSSGHRKEMCLIYTAAAAVHGGTTVVTGCPGRCGQDISDRRGIVQRYLLDRNMRLEAEDPGTTSRAKAESPSLRSDHLWQSDEVHQRRRSVADESCSGRGNQLKSLEHVPQGATVQCQRWSSTQTLGCTSKHKRVAEGSDRGTTHPWTSNGRTSRLHHARYVP